ncbi:cytochrome P450 [Athelia psychrophila]|uniref:Cytochrome P450 n=1 Tax=Athelia psychrophila TaxID=1759441 RepID=A0A166V839_9AGAM|nr:cytochrome P450 [Fibularhizoctonia sp. CBS 109695]
MESASCRAFLSQGLVVCALLVVARGLYWLLNMLVILPFFDPLSALPGPDGSFRQSHFFNILDPIRSPKYHKAWAAKHGNVFRFHGLGGFDHRLMLLDMRAVSHVLNSPTQFEKPWQTRNFISRLVGHGIFTSAGAHHRRQRKIIAPAFSTQAIKAYIPIFQQKAEELLDRWATLIPEPSVSSSEEIPHLPDSEGARACDKETRPLPNNVVDIGGWLTRATFDIIGLSAFGYVFDSLRDPTEEVYLAYRNMFDLADRGSGLMTLVRIYFPWLEYFLWDNETMVTKNSRRIIIKVGRKLVEDKKAAISADKGGSDDSIHKDLLGRLIKSNLSSDPSKGLSDQELLDQLSTFLLVGADTVSLTISWCLHLLSLYPELQTRLRDEILQLPANPAPGTESSSSNLDTAWADAIDALPYLDGVLRETLRLGSPVHGFLRTPVQDEDIPVSSPIKLRDGREVTSIRVRKGTYIHIPIEGLNMSEDIWGADALEFNPDRWANLPENARAPKHPGFANLMSFSFGPQSCLGWKFTLLEAKIFLAVLLPHFVFAPAAKIAKFNAILSRPYVYREYTKGERLPMAISRYHPA